MDINPVSSFFDNRGLLRGSVVGVLAILSLYLLAQTITLASNFGRSGAPATDTITVQGTGKVTLPPDVARINFTVQNTNATVAEAQAATTKQANAAIDALKKQGIAEKDLRTQSYTVYPQYSYRNPCIYGVECPVDSGAPKIVGYQVAQSVEVTVRNLKKVGDILQLVGELGVQNVSGPNFALDDSTAGYTAARAEAIANARAQAQTLSSQLGVRLGKVVNFSESSGGYYPMYAASAYDKAAGMGGDTPTIPVGENTYNASVSVTYEIR